MEYIDLMNLGFKREDMSDSIFFNRFGYNDFCVSLQLNDFLGFSWEHTKPDYVTLRRYDKNGMIMNEMNMIDFETLRLFISFFTDKRCKELKTPNILITRPENEDSFLNFA